MATSLPLDAVRRLDATIASGDQLDVREFQVTERMSGLFEVTIVALCANEGGWAVSDAGKRRGSTQHGDGTST